VIATALLVVVVGGSPSRAAPEEASASAVVKRMTESVVGVLNDGSKSAAERRRGIEQITAENIDFEMISRLVLTRWWPRLSAAEQKDFVEQFQQQLAVTYGKNFEHFHDETVEVLGDRALSGGDWKVLTRIVRPSAQDVTVNYRLRKTGERWRIIDVLIEGVSLVSSFRSQCHEILGDGGTQHLLQVLREKNAAGTS
jgi:phospholipid transport system substrate-binding protein